MKRPPVKEGSCKVYLRVSVEFTKEGDMIPTSLVWEDGRKYAIDRVLSVRPAPALKAGGQGDRYEIMVGGKSRYIWFAHNEDIADKRVGWWFAERSDR
jgi:hypothetical protein